MLSSSDKSSRLVMTDVCKSYGTTQALNQLSLNIEKPGVYAILGHNGAGKTTLINCALGLEKISSGNMTTLGWKPGDIKAKLRTGVILQNSELPDLLTVNEQIELFASYYHTPFSVTEIIDKCDLGDFANKRYKGLSGGQKRRVQFALAVVGNPDLIFLDEPTTGLDIDARKTLWNVIREFANKGKTIILTTHYLEEAENLADRILIMKAGKIVSDTTPQKIHLEAKGSVIQCQTRLPQSSITSLPGVDSVSEKGKFLEIRSSDATATLRELIAQDPQISSLTVSKPSLETFFAQIENSESAQ